MRQSGKCPKCGSQNLLENARPVLHHEGAVELAVYDRPEALLFKERRHATRWVPGSARLVVTPSSTACDPLRLRPPGGAGL
jgi:hypothetical protein